VRVCVCAKVFGKNGILDKCKVLDARAATEDELLTVHTQVLCVLQYVAVCCSALQRVAACCCVFRGRVADYAHAGALCAAVCCNVLQCVAACCSVLQRVAVCCFVLLCVQKTSC